MEQEFPKYETISHGERIERDPRGLFPVTLLSNSVIIRTDQFPPAKPKESLELINEENTENIEVKEE